MKMNHTNDMRWILFNVKYNERGKVGNVDFSRFWHSLKVEKWSYSKCLEIQDIINIDKLSYRKLLVL